MLVQQAAGRLTVMPGSGMNDRNLIEVVRNTGAQAVHMSATAGRQSYMEVRSEEMGDLVDHYQLYDSNEITIARAVQAWAAWEASQAREASPNLV